MSLWFVAGILAAVNPCGFILLPTYLMYFLGMQSDEPSPQRETLRRALKVAGSLSAGFLAVFLVVATISQVFTSWIEQNAKYATGFFGVALVVLGAAMLFGFKLPMMSPQVGTGERDQTFRSMFVYGVAYAIASLGCTIGFFITALFVTSRNGGVFTGVQNGIAYAAGMALLVGSLTVALAFANNGLLKVLRSVLQYMDRLAAAFVLLSGLYLLWYFWKVDLQEEGDVITDTVADWQTTIQTYINNNQWGVAVTMFALVGATMAYVYLRNWAQLGILAVVGLPVGLIASRDVTATIIVGVAVLAAGAIGVVMETRTQHDRSPLDDVEPSELSDDSRSTLA